MQKIISLFKRNYEKTSLTINDLVIPAHQVYNEVVPGDEWVLAGEGVATRKWDGTCCKIENGVLWKRYDAKNGKKPPEGFVPAQEPDPVTGHWPGWLQVGAGKEDKWFRAAVEGYGILSAEFEDGTYELVGPAINGNPEHFESHHLIKHGNHTIRYFPRDFEGIRKYLSTAGFEGIVWHHADGRMVKIKAKDFGIKKPD